MSVPDDANKPVKELGNTWALCKCVMEREEKTIVINLETNEVKPSNMG